MKNKVLLLLLVALMVFVSGCETNQAQSTQIQVPESVEVEELSSSRIVADKFVENLVAKEYSTVYSLLAPNMKNMVVAPIGVRIMWEQVTAQIGQDFTYGSAILVSSDGKSDTYNYPVEVKSGEKHIVSITVDNDLVSMLSLTEDVEETLTLGEQFIDAVIKGEYDKAYAMSDTTMKSALGSADGLKTVWNQITSQIGKYVSSEAPSIVPVGDVTVYVISAIFENTPCIIQISEANNEIAGFMVQPSQVVENINNTAKTEGPKASLDLPDGVLEKDIIVNKGEEHELYGKLTYPENVQGPIPVVVLVQGSGSSDMDEKINEHNAPFKDIAYGLSQNGIAVLRYNKVTYAYPNDFKNSTITIDEETVNDAVAAKTALIEQADMEFSKMYVLGHSLGGMMAPKIASIGEYDGMVILAGTTRSLLDVVYDQKVYITRLIYSDPEILALYEASYKASLDEAKNIMQLPKEELKDKTVMDMSAQYIYSIENPPSVGYIKELDIPMLILQGSKDFQVLVDKDFMLYEDVTKGLTDVTMIEYDGLNHLFMESFMEHPDTTEYSAPSKVSDQVIKDISEWILSR